MRECPCNGCTAETGRSPTCHGDGTCTRGHDEWKQEQIAAARRKRSAQERENMMRGYAVETARRNNKRRKHGDKQ